MQHHHREVSSEPLISLVGKENLGTHPAHPSTGIALWKPVVIFHTNKTAGKSDCADKQRKTCNHQQIDLGRLNSYWATLKKQSQPVVLLTYRVKSGAHADWGTLQSRDPPDSNPQTRSFFGTTVWIAYAHKRRRTTAPLRVKGVFWTHITRRAMDNS